MQNITGYGSNDEHYHGNVAAGVAIKGEEVSKLHAEAEIDNRQIDKRIWVVDSHHQNACHREVDQIAVVGAHLQFVVDNL